MEQMRPDLYRRFASIWANGEPVRTAQELAAALRAAGTHEDDVTDEWIRSLSRAWVYGETEEPFADERANRMYRRVLLNG